MFRCVIIRTCCEAWENDDGNGARQAAFMAGLALQQGQAPPSAQQGGVIDQRERVTPCRPDRPDMRGETRHGDHARELRAT